MPRWFAPFKRNVDPFLATEGGSIHFLHIRKTGGTAIKEALLPIAKQRGIVLHRHETTLADIQKDHMFFFFVRHPISRFVSGFYSRLRQGMPRYFSPWTDSEKEAFSYFREANHLAEALWSTDPIISAKAHFAMTAISHVNSTYKTWFDCQETLDRRLDGLVLVGLQEKLETDFEILKSLLHLPKEVKLPTDDVRAHRDPRTTGRTLSRLGQESLRKWYAEDIEFYEHCVGLRKLLIGSLARSGLLLLPSQQETLQS